MIKAELVNTYTSESGVEVNVYSVIEGTEAEMNDFQETQESIDLYRTDDDGNVLFFVPGDFKGDVVRLVKGKVRDRNTGELVPGYKAMALENFRIKTQVIQKDMGIAPVKKVVRPVAKISAEDASF